MPFLSGNKKKEKLVEEILLQQYDKYYRLAYSHVHNASDAADIVQNGAYQAILHSDSLKNPEAASSWIYRIMLNEIYDFYRKPAYVPLEEIQNAGCDDRYANLDLQKALNTLSPEEKSIIFLRFFEDMKLEEIAEILGENINTIKSRLYRCMKKLRLLLKEDVSPS